MTECDSFKNPLRAIGSHTTLPLRYGQCLTYAHSQITKDVGSHGRLFVLVRSYQQHGISVGEEQDLKDQFIAGFGVVLIVKSRTYYGMRY